MIKNILLICGVLSLCYIQITNSYSENINKDHFMDFEKDFYDFGLTKEEVDDFMEIFSIIDQQYINDLNKK